MKATLISLITNSGLLITLLAVFLLFFSLGSTTLTNFDEAWFASVAADMAASRDFLVGHWNGQVWFYEPPVLTWVLAGIMSVLGKQEFWLRSFNALCGLLTVLLSVQLSHIVSGSRLAGFLTGTILLSNIEFLFRSRQINAEVPVTLFLLASLSSSFMAAKTRKTRWLVSTGFFLGLSFLTKRASPILVIPAIVYVFWKSDSRMKLRNFLLLLLTFLSITLPWYGYQYWRFGDQFVNEFFLGYTIGKIRAVNMGTGASPLFYLFALKHAFKFWSLVIPIAVGWSIWVARKKQEYRVLLLYAATFFFALTAASIKSSWFLLPAHPILAVIAGSFLARICHSGGNVSDWRAGRIRRFSIVFGSLIVSASQLFIYRHQFIVPETTRHQVDIVKYAASLTREDEPFYLDDGYLPVAVFYSGRRVIPLRFDRAQPVISLDVPSGSVVLSNTETVERLKAHINLPVETLASERDLLLLRVGPGEEKENQEEKGGDRKV